MKEWVRDLILELDVDNDVIRVGLLMFSDEEELIFHLNGHDNREDMLTALEEDVVYLRGTTNTADAISYAHNTMFTGGRGDRGGAKNIILLVTNGDSDEPRDTIREARAAKDKGIHILVTVVGNWFTMLEINAIASYPYERNRFHLDDIEDLDEDFAATMQELVCDSQYEYFTITFIWASPHSSQLIPSEELL